MMLNMTWLASEFVVIPAYNAVALFFDRDDGASQKGGACVEVCMRVSKSTRMTLM
jgi:hypothetical protein